MSFINHPKLLPLHTTYTSVATFTQLDSEQEHLFTQILQYHRWNCDKFLSLVNTQQKIRSI